MFATDVMTAIRRSDSPVMKPTSERKNVNKYILIEICSNKIMLLDQIMFPEIPLNDYPH